MTSSFIIEKLDKNQYLYSLNNGLRVVYSMVPNTMLVHCGYMINAGSRNETTENNGIAHFIEHTVFKGTKNRKTNKIFDHIETVGGELNAYTTREKTLFYASVLKNYFERAVDLLTDIVYNPVFPADELEKEKSVIKEEIEMYMDSPEESIFDEFNSKVFDGNSLGLSILGTKKSLKSISKTKIQKFRSENYSGNNIIFTIVGDLKTTTVENIIEKYLTGLPGKPAKKKSADGIHYKPFDKEIPKKFQQVHCVIGNLAYSMHDIRKYPVLLIHNILGGDWMSSRLNMILREKHAYVYNVSSGYNIYTDTGLFTIQFGTDEKYLKKCIELVYNEMKKLRNSVISASQLARAKRQIFGHYAMLDESNSYLMQSQARNILDYDKIIPINEILNNINKLTPAMLLETTEDVFNPKKISKLIYIKK